MRRYLQVILFTMSLVSFLNANIHTPKGAKHACDTGNSSGCYNLGLMYYTGNVVKQNYAKSKVFFSKACARGNTLGCNHYAILNKR